MPTKQKQIGPLKNQKPRDRPNYFILILRLILILILILNHMDMVMVMESLSVLRSSSPPFRNPKLISPLLPKNSCHTSLQRVAKPHFCLTTASLPTLASETLVSSLSEKIDLRSIIVSIDNFIIKYPYFVFTVTFIWLIIIPYTQDYLSKCKSITARDAFRKLRNDPCAQLLDIRDAKTLKFLPSPNLMVLGKENVVQVEYREEDEDEFIKKVLQSFPDPANTVLCLLGRDNDDGEEAYKAAELLFKNGFKEVYPIVGGVRGNYGWLATQDRYFPSTAHIKPRKKKKKKKKVGSLNQGTEDMKHDEKRRLNPDQI